MTSPTMPSDVDEHVGLFDRFASVMALLVSKAIFFAFCVLLILVWAPSFLFLPFDTWQLIINTATTIITFLMVALLQNSQTRSDMAVQHKLNAVADSMADMMDALASTLPDDACRDLLGDRDELRQAVGLEERESTS